MNKIITKTKRSISIDRNLDNILEEKIKNKSQYIEWLIYQDLKKNSEYSDKIKNIIL